MKNYDELAERVFRKAEERIFKRKIRMMRIRRVSIAVSGMCAVILVMFGIWKNDSVKNALNNDFNNKSFITEEDALQNSSAVTTTALKSFEITRTSASEPVTQTTAGNTVSASVTSITQTAHTVLPEVSSGAVTSSSTTKVQTVSGINRTTGTSVPAQTSSAAATETGSLPTGTTSGKMPSVTTTITPSASVTTSETSTTKPQSSKTTTTTTFVRTSSRTSTTTTTTVFWTSSRTSTSTTTISTTIWASESGSSSATTTTRPYQPDPIVTDSDGKIPIYVDYPDLVMQGESLRPWGVYESTVEYKGELCDFDENRIGDYLETVELTDKVGSTTISAEVYKVTKMSPLVCVAVKSEGRSGYSLYRNRYYTPVTLGDMINDMNLMEEAEITSIEWTDEDEGWIREVYADKETVFETLFTDYSILNGADLEYKLAAFTIYIDIPLLNKKNDVIFLGDNGYLATTIVDFNAYFSIDKANVDSLMEYIIENNLYTESPV